MKMIKHTKWLLFPLILLVGISANVSAQDIIPISGSETIKTAENSQKNLSGKDRSKIDLILQKTNYMLAQNSIKSSSALESASQTVVSIVPQSPTSVGNCIPFGQNDAYGFQGFIYRNVPAFTLQVGDKIAFDLGSQNDVDTRRTIFFAPANINPGGTMGRALAL